MVQNQYVVLKSPVKIGDYDRVDSYSKSLVKGEEQLLVTRDCKFFLTDGNGGYLEFKTINSGVTLDEVNQIVNNLNTSLTQDITDMNTDLSKSISDLNTKIENQLDLANNDIATLKETVTNLGLEFSSYVTQEEFDNLSATVTSTTELATHDNRDTLDKFSEDSDGNPLYNDKKIVADFDTSGIEAEIADLNSRSVIGSKLKTGLFKPAVKITGGVGVGIVKMGTKISGDFTFNSDGTVTLPKGSYYKVRGAIRFATSSISGYVSYIIRNFTDSINSGIAATINSYSYWEGQQEAIAYIDTTPKDINIGIYITDVNNAYAAEITDGFTFLDIQEVNRNTIVDPSEDGKNINFEYGHFTFSQTSNLSVGNHIEMNMVKGNMTISSGIGQAKGLITLKANKKYDFDFAYSNGGTTSNSIIDLAVTDSSGNVLFDIGYAYPTTYADNTQASPATSFILEPIIDTVIQFRITANASTSIWGNLVIKEIAQPYYFNYFKDSISSTILFSGNANAVGHTYSLSDSIKNYDKLILYSCCIIDGIQREKASNIINVSDITGKSVYENIVGFGINSSTFYFIEIGFITDTSFTIGNDGSTLWSSPCIYKIEGIGYNYYNPYEDIITTSPDAALTDTQVDSDITTIWNGVGL